MNRSLTRTLQPEDTNTVLAWVEIDDQLSWREMVLSLSVQSSQASCLLSRDAKASLFYVAGCR